MDIEPTINDLIDTATRMLNGKAFTDFCYYQFRQDWWNYRLYMSRN